LILIVSLAGVKTWLQLEANVLDFHTGLAFFFAVSAGAILLVSILTRVLKKPRKSQRFIFIQSLWVILILFVFEMALRQMGSFATYGEQNGGRNYYSQITGENRDSWYYLHEANRSIAFQKIEFDWTRTTNSLGLSEMEIPIEKTSGEFRILALGDSFTEGDGVPYDSTWLKIMEHSLSTKYPGRQIRTINAGIGGSDPVYQYVLLRDSLLQLLPDLVILSTNETDLYEVSIRGGMDRFRADGTIKLMEEPSWEWIYGISHIARFLIRTVGGYSASLGLGKQHPPDQGPKVIAQAISDIEELGKIHQFQTLVITHPLQSEMYHQSGDNGEYMTQLQAKVRKSSVPLLDLKPLYQVQGYTTREKTAEIFWAKNGHFNAFGYQLYGEWVAAEIEALNLMPESAEPDLPSDLLD